MVLGLPSASFNPPKSTPGGADTIFAERQNAHLVFGLLESLKITEINKSSITVTELQLQVSTKVKVRC